MNKIIIAFDGANDVGKTSFINSFCEKYEICKSFALSFNSLISDENWWFRDSAPEELIDQIVILLKERSKKIDQVYSGIILLDKSQRTLEARLYAIFKLRNFEEKYIDNILNSFREKTKKYLDYDISILFENKNIIYSNDFLNKYNNIQREYLHKLPFDIFENMITNNLYPGKNFEEKLELLIRRKLINDNNVTMIDSNVLVSDFFYKNISTIEIKDLEIDDIFKGILLDVITRILAKERDNILLLSAVGSCAFQSAIKFWSDIDLLIILKTDDINFLNWIYSLVDEYDIHIGISCFNENNIQKFDLDNKSKWSIYYIQNCIIKPFYLSESFVSSKIELENFKSEEIYILKEHRYIIRRLLYSNSSNSKLLLKKTLDYVKLFLHKYNIIVGTVLHISEFLKLIWGIDTEEYFSVNDFPNLNLISVRKFATIILENLK